MKKLLLVVNPKAGKTIIRNDFFEIILKFSEAGYNVNVYPTKGPGDAARVVREEGAEYDLVVCAGGDGTLENTVEGYMTMGENKTPIGYIPVGTTNDFARSLRISRKPLEAVSQIINGSENLVDVGKFDDDYFIYIAAFGIFTDISYTTNQSLKKVMGHTAYIVEALKNIINYKAFTIEAELDEALITGEYIFGMVTNSFSVGGFRTIGAKHIILDDGRFDCLFIRKPQNPIELKQIITSVVTNNIDNEMFFQKKASKVIVRCEEEIPWTIDGEFGGKKKEVFIENIQKSVAIYLEEEYVPDGLANKEDNYMEFDEMYYTNDSDDDYIDSWK